MNKKARGIIPRDSSDIPRRIKIFFFLIFFVLLFGTISFSLIEDKPLNKSFIKTLETLAFMFSAQSSLGRFIEIFLALFGVFIVWWIFWSIFDMLIEGKISEYLNISRTHSILKGMGNHRIIIGGGRVGEEIAKTLNKQKKEFVIIEKSNLIVDKLRKKGYLVIEGELSGEEETSTILHQANIKDAEKVIITTPETEKNLLMVLIIREINPSIEIYSRADKQSYINRLKKAGVKTVIVPELAVAEKFIQEI
jgi:voltage-gated potassium channel